jgi:putative membrane protein
MPDHHAVPALGADLVLGSALLVGAIGYLAAAAASRGRGRWPAYRNTLWCGGLGAVAASALGPLSEAAHRDFPAHMAQHLLLGMLGPLLLVSAAPVTLALRVLPVSHGRRLSRLLASQPVRYVSHPVTAAVLNMGGLWILYTTGLYQAMREHQALHIVVHAHVLVAGYLLTFALVGVDPAPHRPGYSSRAAVLVLYLAAHAILAKYLYAHPPAGMPSSQGQRGAMLMYYGGDAVALGLIVAFCSQWLAAARPRQRATALRNTKAPS